jgi:hypothetical protein
MEDLRISEMGAIAVWFSQESDNLYR